MKKLVTKYMKKNYPNFDKIAVVDENTYQCWFVGTTYIDLTFKIIAYSNEIKRTEKKSEQEQRETYKIRRAMGKYTCSFGI